MRHILLKVSISAKIPLPSRAIRRTYVYVPYFYVGYATKYKVATSHNIKFLKIWFHICTRSGITQFVIVMSCFCEWEVPFLWHIPRESRAYCASRWGWRFCLRCPPRAVWTAQWSVETKTQNISSSFNLRIDKKAQCLSLTNAPNLIDKYNVAFWNKQ